MNICIDNFLIAPYIFQQNFNSLPLNGINNPGHHDGKTFLNEATSTTHVFQAYNSSKISQPSKSITARFSKANKRTCHSCQQF